MAAGRCGRVSGRACRTAAIESCRASTPCPSTSEDFDELKKHFDAGQIVEIVATIALFGYLNRWNDTCATTLESRALEVANRAIGAVGWQAGKHGV